MISTGEEAMLLLNKWTSDAERPARLIALGACKGIVFRSTGVITQLDPDGTFAFGDEGNDDFVIVSLKGCRFGFDDKIPLPEILTKLVPSDWNSLLFVRFPDETALVLFAL